MASSICLRWVDTQFEKLLFVWMSIVRALVAQLSHLLQISGQLMRIFFAALIAMMLNGCSSELDTEAMFKRHVAPVPINTVTELQWGQAQCMHCPLYFSFVADEKFVKELVASHLMKEVTAITEDISREEQIVKSTVAWWKMADIDAGHKVYWARFDSKNEGEDPIFRLLVVDHNRIYFIKRGWLEERK